MTPWGQDSRSEAWLQEPRGRAAGAHGWPCNIPDPHDSVGNAQRALAREGSDGTLSFYVTGEPGKNFEDLCAGPHVPSTGKLKSFKQLSLAGAYWHGDQNSDQLTRVYGTCFADKEGLETHLKFLEEAEKRDHRRIGKEKRASRVSRRKACFSA